VLLYTRLLGRFDMELQPPWVWSVVSDHGVIAIKFMDYPPDVRRFAST
jgi:hypothetical protein